MSETSNNKQDLLKRVDALLEESFHLPRTMESWERRQKIEWELVLLFRQIAERSSGPLPYWTDPDWKEPLPKRRPSSPIGRRRDRTALPPPYGLLARR